ncbi:MAG: hypothetical protein ACTSQQ_03155 [Candidatus Helarchaeota archaeon]
MVKYWERFLLGGVLTPVGILVTIVAINALLTAEGQPDSGFIKEHRNKNKDIS